MSGYIIAHEHIVLAGPRRYGKTGLIAQVLKENSFAGTSIDLFFVLTQSDVTKSILDGISKIMSQLLPKTKKATNKLLESISAANPKLTFNLLGQKLEINTRQHTDKSISEMLLALDQFMEKIKQTCVIVFDEFQL